MVASNAWGAWALIGPTASGKSAAALQLAERLPIEIISMDSALVYRGMDIGTAKPTPEEQARVPHHLIDILDPTESYSAAQFARDALALIPAIQARGRWPVLVGGTLLYLKALIDGLDELPVADPSVRAQWQARGAEQGWPALHAVLAQVDPVTAQRLAPNDAQRIGRALEVWTITGQALSSLHGQSPRTAAMPNIGLISFEPRDRAWLHARIEQRFEAMVSQGFLDEVRTLKARGDLHPELPSMRCVGYRQAWAVLDELPNPQAPLSPAHIQRWLETGKAATRQLAKRQLTWLRGLPQRRVVDCDDPHFMDTWMDTLPQDPQGLTQP
jgi:tRNA dimethylallyltransferase